MRKPSLSERTAPIRLSPIREVTAKVEAVLKKGREVVNFGAGRPDFDTPLHIKEAAHQALAQGLVHYTKSMGLDSLREAVSRRLQDDFQLDLAPERIIITMGSTEAISVALQTILNPGDQVLAPDPMYVYYEGWVLLGGASLVRVPLSAGDGFHLRAEAVRDLVTPDTKALILNSPHNPTGQVFAAEEIAKLGAVAVEKDFYVVCDDIYNYLVYDQTELLPMAKVQGMEDRAIIIGSLSKTYAMDGWRVGYLAGPEEVISRALKVHQYLVACSNTFVQLGAQAALSSSQSCVQEMVEEFDRRRLLLLSCLEDLQIPCVRPRGAFYVFPSIAKFGLSSSRFSDFLLEEAGVAVVPGDAFGPGGEGFIRMAYCLPGEDIERGMERFGKALLKL